MGGHDLANRFLIHYGKMLSICRSLKEAGKADAITCDQTASFELLPAMYVLADYVFFTQRKDRYEYAHLILSEIRKIVPTTGYSFSDLQKRIDFYGEIIRGRKLRCHWCTGSPLANTHNALLCCLVALCDILSDPHCAEDYECPTMIFNIFELQYFLELVAVPLKDALLSFAEEMSML